MQFNADTFLYHNGLLHHKILTNIFGNYGSSRRRRGWKRLGADPVHHRDLQSAARAGHPRHTEQTEEEVTMHKSANVMFTSFCPICLVNICLCYQHNTFSRVLRLYSLSCKQMINI